MNIYIALTKPLTRLSATYSEVRNVCISYSSAGWISEHAISYEFILLQTPSFFLRQDCKWKL